MVQSRSRRLGRGPKTVSCLLLSLLAACSNEDSTPPGEAPPQVRSLSSIFAGHWQTARPELDGVIVNMPTVSCEDPVVISQNGPDKLIRTSPNGAPLPLTLNTLPNERIAWIPDDMSSPYSFIAEVKNGDKFWLYSVFIGKADWDDPREYIKCQ